MIQDQQQQIEALKNRLPPRTMPCQRVDLYQCGTEKLEQELAAELSKTQPPSAAAASPSAPSGTSDTVRAFAIARAGIGLYDNQLRRADGRGLVNRF